MMKGDFLTKSRRGNKRTSFNMTDTRIFKTKKVLIVGASLLLGFLMPYISRIPYSFTYGTAWIFKYMPNDGDFARWNGLHLISLIPMCIFGIVFVVANVRWCFYASVIGQVVMTSVVYYNFAEPAYSDDFLGCIVFPPMFAFVSFLCGIVALIAELIVQNRKSGKTKI
jgi:hypothetical protein